MISVIKREGKEWKKPLRKRGKRVSSTRVPARTVGGRVGGKPEEEKKGKGARYLITINMLERSHREAQERLNKGSQKGRFLGKILTGIFKPVNPPPKKTSPSSVVLSREGPDSWGESGGQRVAGPPPQKGRVRRGG